MKNKLGMEVHPTDDLITSADCSTKAIELRMAYDSIASEHPELKAALDPLLDTAKETSYDNGYDKGWDDGYDSGRFFAG